MADMYPKACKSVASDDDMNDDEYDQDAYLKDLLGQLDHLETQQVSYLHALHSDIDHELRKAMNYERSIETSLDALEHVRQATVQMLADDECGWLFAESAIKRVCLMNAGLPAARDIDELKAEIEERRRKLEELECAEQMVREEMVVGFGYVDGGEELGV